MPFLWNVFEFIVTVFEAFVLTHFIFGFLGHKLKTRKEKIIYILGSIGYAIIVIIFNKITVFEGFLGIVYSLYYFLYALFFLKGRVIKKLLASILENLIMVFVSTLGASIVSAAFQSDIIDIYTKSGVERFIGVIAVQILLVYVCEVILKIFPANKELSFGLKEWIFIISVFVVSFVSFMFIHVTVLGSYQPETKYLIIPEFGIIVVNIICFYMIVALNKSKNEAMKLKILSHQQEQRAQYAENVRKQYEEIRIIRHDMKQKLAVINMMQKNNKIQEAIEFTNKCTDNISKTDMVIDVGNDFINAILSTKLSLAKEKDINIICRSSSDVSGIEDIDLCVLLGNILDNAIEACEKGTEKNIEVSIYSDSTKLIITVINDIDFSVLSDNPDLNTSKTDISSHGYGVKTIKSIAEKYNGQASFYEENNKFVCQVNLFK